MLGVKEGFVCLQKGTMIYKDSCFEGELIVVRKRRRRRTMTAVRVYEEVCCRLLFGSEVSGGVLEVVCVSEGSRLVEVEGIRFRFGMLFRMR